MVDLKKKKKNLDFSFFNEIYQNLRNFGMCTKNSKTLLLTIKFYHSKQIKSMLDTFYNHFDPNSKLQNPKKCGPVQNMSFREL